MTTEFYTQEIEGETHRKFVEQTKQRPTGYLKFQPYNQILPKVYLQSIKRVEEFQVRNDDVWVVTFPKAGTTWTQETVWLIINNLNFDAAKATEIDKRSPFLELKAITEDETKLLYLPDNLEVVEKLESPRVIMTHLSWQMLPEQARSNQNVKIIYVFRNPRDVVVSLYNHHKILEGYSGSFEDFAEAFTSDVAGYYSPYFSHVFDYWKQRNRPNICITSYEDMKKDLKSVVEKFCIFLDKDVPQGDKMKELLDHLSFDKMKNNKAVNREDLVKATGFPNDGNEGNFMRKGETGTWKNWFTTEQIKRFEEWEESWLKGSGFSFQFE